MGEPTEIQRIMAARNAAGTAEAWWAGLSAADQAAARRRFEAGAAEQRRPVTRLLTFFALLLAAVPAAAQQPGTDWASRLTEGDVTAPNFRFRSGETPAGAAPPLCDARHPAPRRRRATSSTR